MRGAVDAVVLSQNHELQREGRVPSGCLNGIDAPCRDSHVSVLGDVTALRSGRLNRISLRKTLVDEYLAEPEILVSWHIK